MNIRDVVHRIPEKREELSDYITTSYDHIRELLESDPTHKKTLDDAVAKSYDKYSKYLGGLADKVSKVGHGVGFAADAWLLPGDIVGSIPSDAWH